MNIFRPIIHLLIRIYSWPLHFPTLIKLTFQKVRQREFWKFYDEVFLNDYPHIHRACQLLQNEDSTVIFDIGGGQGTTLKIFNQEVKNADIHLFEPIGSNFSIIENEFGRIPNITLHNEALGEEEGESVIHVADRITSSSLLDLNPFAHEKGTYLNEALQLKREETIRLNKLSNYLESLEFVNLIKLDVQGYELHVLRGAGEHISKVKYILLEVSSHDGYSGAPQYYEIDEFMRDKGFQLADLFPGIKTNGVLKEWDCIYINAKWT